MKIKELEFKNGRKVEIVMSSFNVGEFNLFALDEKKKIVAKCGFDIISTYILKQPSNSTNTEQSSSTAIRPVFQALKIKAGDLKTKQPDHKKIIFRHGGIYSLQDTRCELKLIEICDEKFYKVGLGTELFKLMEDFSIQQNCTKISAWVYPIGPFSMGAMEFYKRNGFSFTKDETNHTIATKLLQKEKIDGVSKNEIIV